MSSRSRILLFVTLLSPSARSAFAADESNESAFPYTLHRRTLDNGLEAVVVRTPTPGAAAVGTWMAVGSRDELDAGRTGFAHFFEHLMFLGTPTLDAEGRELAMLEMAADDNAWTWLDETVYHVTLPSQHVPRLLGIEADRFANLTLTEDDVRREAGAVYGEFRKSQANPVRRLYDALYGMAFPTHTYGHSTLGYEDDIADMPTAHAYASAFFDRMYRPGNARVIVVGDVDPDDTLDLVDGAFAGWRPGTVPREEPPMEPPPEGPRDATVDWPRPTAPMLALGWRIPGVDPDDVDRAALELLGELLLGEVGPLQRRLVREEGLAFDVWGGADEFVDPCLFKILVRLRPGASLEAVEAVIAEELAAQGDLAPEVLDRARAHVRYGLLSGLDDPRSVLNTVGWALRRDAGPDPVGRSLRSLDAVTPADVAHASAVLSPDTRVRVVLAHTEEEE